MSVLVVWHIHHVALPHQAAGGTVEFDDSDDQKLIGIYSTRAKAEAAIDRARVLDGFRDEPDCFILDEVTLDEDNWTDGFVTV